MKHQHEYIEGKSKKVAVCICGRFQHINTKPEDIITAIEYREIPLLAAHNVRAFIGGCYLRGVGSKFRAKAHAHTTERIICFRSDKWINRVELLTHELAHVLTGAGHDDKWRAKVAELGGTIQEVPGLLRSYEKKTRGKRFIKSPDKFLADLGFVREVRR